MSPTYYWNTSLAEEIDALRNQLEKIYCKNGGISEEVLRLSRKLDQKIVEYIQLGGQP